MTRSSACFLVPMTRACRNFLSFPSRTVCDMFVLCGRMTGSADVMASQVEEGLLPGSLATGRPPAWGLNSVSAVGSHTLDSLISQVHWNAGTQPPKLRISVAVSHAASGSAVTWHAAAVILQMTGTMLCFACRYEAHWCCMDASAAAVQGVWSCLCICCPALVHASPSLPCIHVHCHAHMFVSSSVFNSMRPSSS